MALVRYLTENPFATDEQLADYFAVSVATIRLDRSTLHIPEVRERTRLVAAARQDGVRSLQEREVVGDVLELRLNRTATSALAITPLHVFLRTGIVRGHVLFAQVNSLATALVDADVALTAKTELRYHAPARLGDTVVARVDVVARRFAATKCRVTSRVGTETVLDGVIWVVKGQQDERRATGGMKDEVGG